MGRGDWEDLGKLVPERNNQIEGREGGPSAEGIGDPKILLNEGVTPLVMVLRTQMFVTESRRGPPKKKLHHSICTFTQLLKLNRIEPCPN